MQSEPSILHQLFDDAFNEGDLTVLDELFAADAVLHIPMWGLPNNLRGFKQMIFTLRNAFPDLLFTLENEIREKEKYSAIWLLQGVHNGQFFGNLPTGRSVTFMGFIFACTKGFQIVEGWSMIDQMGLLQQLGIVPPPRGNVDRNRGEG